jgi:transcriptional regulator with XRE-family HTH domain
MKRKKNSGFNLIKEVIKSQGRNEIWIAQELGISKTTLSNYCAFVREPPLDLLFRIANLLQVSVTSLINLEAKVEDETMIKKPKTNVK